MTDSVETSDEKQEREAMEKGIQDALSEVSGIKLMIDTNVINTACGRKSDQQKVIIDILAQNETNISTTIFWEFLRNCSLEKFRDRYEFLSSNQNWFNIVTENQYVGKMFKVIWATYLCCFKDDPRKMASIKIPDLWIVAATAQMEIENILTFDNSDFPDELFHKKKYYLGNQSTILLMTINREALRKYLKEALDKGVLISFQEFRQS